MSHGYVSLSASIPNAAKHIQKTLPKKDCDSENLGPPFKKMAENKWLSLRVMICYNNNPCKWSYSPTYNW